MRDSCLKHSKIKVLKMLDLQTKSAIDSDKLQVQHRASNLAFLIGKIMLTQNLGLHKIGRINNLTLGKNILSLSNL
jgi:hypothetical protein